MDLQAGRGRAQGPDGDAKAPSSSSNSDSQTEARNQAALKYLFQETSVELIRQCFAKIRDQELSRYLQESVLRIAALLSSEAFTGLEQVRKELRAERTTVALNPVGARRLYEQHAELIGQLHFALSRRLSQFEEFLSECPFSGSSEVERGRYGQRVRDLAGDLRFLRLELQRWVNRAVPLRGELPDGMEGRAYLIGRVDAVVDDLGLRLKEIQEVLTGAIFDQLLLFDENLTRGKLFKRDLNNVLDTERLLAWLSELMSSVRDYDDRRQPEQLRRVKSLLREFDPEQFPTLSGVRESDHAMFLKFIPRILDYTHGPKQKGDDPIHVFLLLVGDMVRAMPNSQ
jgi:hypothetical protein